MALPNLENLKSVLDCVAGIFFNRHNGLNGTTRPTETRLYGDLLDSQMDDGDSVGQAAVGYLREAYFLEQF